MDRISKDSRKLVSVYRKAVEQREARENSLALGIEPDQAKKQKKKDDKVAKKDTKQKTTSKDKVKKSKPIEDPKKSEPKKADTKDTEKLLPSEAKERIKRFKKQFPYMQNRELSWLEFNKRVLDQSADPTVPIFERLGFLSIFWSNLQEFFMVRVGSLTDLSLIKKTIIDSKSGMTPVEQLSAIYARCHELYPYYEKCYKELRTLLAEEGIVSLKGKNLNEEQVEFAQDYFEANIMPFLSPQIINARHPFPHLENGALYIVVRLDEDALPVANGQEKSDKDGKKKKSAKNLGAKGVTLGIIPLPRQCQRLIKLPGEGLQFILLEHVIELFVQRIFSMYKVKHTNVICVTRNADLDATEGIEEQGEDYREHMKRILKKRSRLMPVRLESEKELSQTVKPVLLERLNLHPAQSFVTSVPLNLSYVFELPSLVDEQKREALSNEPFTPEWPASIDRNRSIIEQVEEKELLLSYPYESMDAFIQLLREAAHDPDVISIKITLYRLAKQSHLAEALIAAADAGKEVTALFELRARFDESNNIEWSQRFDQAGCNVLYGFRDYKVHSKICSITRQTEDGVQYITQLGTGNYNEKTAKLYTDLSFITTDEAIGRDALQFFRNMALENTSDDYSTLWVAPLQIKQNIIAGIDEQIAKHKAGEETGIFFKTNSITDKEVIDKLVEASQAGVKCNLLVRGISCIIPGIEGYTDNIRVSSIVGRLLEHSRIYCFGPADGDSKVYLSSADLMTRNMDKRIEIAWPIKNEQLREIVIGYIATCMADTAKLRDLLPNCEYTELGYFASAANNSGRVELFDSQSYLIDEAQRMRLEAAEASVYGVANRSALVRELENVEIDVEKLSDVLGEEVVEYQDVADAMINTLPDEEVADLPYIEGVPRYDVLVGDDAQNASETWDIPNFGSGESMTLAVDERPTEAEQAFEPEQQSSEPPVYDVVENADEDVAVFAYGAKNIATSDGFVQDTVSTDESVAPMQASEYVSLVDVDENAVPVQEGEYYAPVETAEYVAPVDADDYIASGDNDAYVVPGETSEHVASNAPNGSYLTSLDPGFPDANMTQVYGMAPAIDNAPVYDGAPAYGNAPVYDGAPAYDNAPVHEDAPMYGNSPVYAETPMNGNASSFEYENSSVYGDVPAVDPYAVVANDDVTPLPNETAQMDGNAEQESLSEEKKGFFRRFFGE